MPKNSPTLLSRLRRWIGISYDGYFVLRAKQLLSRFVDFDRETPRKRKPTYLPRIELLETRLVPTKVGFQSSAGTVLETVSSVTMTVALDATSAATITVDYATANDTATAGTDYTATSGTLTFAPGDLTHTISVPILGHPETSNCDFKVSLSNAVNATIGSISLFATDTILIDETPSIQFSASSVARKVGCNLMGVFYQRKKLGIPSYRRS